MICSFSYNFLFIKTTKTASSSIEIGLSKFCKGPDIFTPIWSDGSDKPEGEVERAARNNALQWQDMGLRDFVSTLYNLRRPSRFGNHEGAASVRKKLNPKTWEDLYKFTVVRNPYDRIVSMYFWQMRNKRNTKLPTVFQWLCENPLVPNETWRLCAEDGSFILDDFIRYENLEDDLRRVGKHLGLPSDLRDAVFEKRLKTSQRPPNASVDTVLDPSSRELIQLMCRREFEVFGYDP
ncbi:MAG: sulfotransferase family 2 domain-containing protein [Roseovarius sp.]|jgi:hypothetical protein|uniref:sulfotransferase family 2 domain-containing protein n=1 Tax=Roseovarius sp. TaxID=1486281 RepID=UPI0032EF64B8